MLGRIWNLIVKEFLQLSRDRLLVAFLILGPILQLTLLTQATGTGVDHLALAVLDLDGSRVSRQLITALDNTEELDVRYYSGKMGEVGRLLHRGRADVALIIPAGFSQDLGLAKTQVQVIADGSNSIIASVGLSVAEGVVADFAHNLVMAYRGSEEEAIDLRINVLFNPTLKTRPYTTSAQLGFIVYQVTLTVAALGIARERELGTLEQLIVTPLRSFELIVGKAIPAMIMGAVDFIALFAVAISVFHLRMEGSFALLLGLTLLFIAAEVGWGLMISIHSRSQQQAVLFVFLLAMIDMTFSGYLVQVEKMPWLLRTISNLFPFQHYLTVLRDVIFKGTRLNLLWGEIGALTILGMGISLIAFLRIKKRLD